MIGSIRAAAFAAVLLLAWPHGVGANEALWDLLKGGGQVVLLRHATTTPGVGDPPGFRVEECARQRNLSEQGRQEARRLGAAFRDRGHPRGPSAFEPVLPMPGDGPTSRSDAPSPIRRSIT